MKRVYVILISLIGLMVACDDERCEEPIQTTEPGSACYYTNFRLVPVDTNDNNLFDNGVLDTAKIYIYDTSGKEILFYIMPNSNDSLYGKVSILLPPRGGGSDREKGYCGRVDRIFINIHGNNYNEGMDTLDYKFIISYGDSTIKNDTILLHFREEPNPYPDPNTGDCVEYGPTYIVMYIYHVKNDSLVLLNYACSHGPCERVGYFFIKYVKNI